MDGELSTAIGYFSVATGSLWAMGLLAGAVGGGKSQEEKSPPRTERASPPREIGASRQMVDRQRRREAAKGASGPHENHGHSGPAWPQQQSHVGAGSFTAWLADCIEVPEVPDDRETIPFVTVMRSYYEYCGSRQLPALSNDEFARSIMAAAETARYGYTEKGDLIGARFKQ